MHLLVVIYIFCFAIGNLGRISATYDINIILLDVLTFFFVCIYFAKYRSLKKPDVIAQKEFLVFILIALFSFILGALSLKFHQSIAGLMYLFRFVIYFIFAHIVLRYVKSKKISKFKIINYLILTGCLLAIFGLLQYLFLPDLRFLEKFGWDPHYYRLVGSLLDPNYTGLFLVLTLILLVVKIYTQVNKSNILYLLTLIVWIALALTFSRSSYVSYIAVLTVAVVLVKLNFTKKALLWLTGILLLAITIPLLPKPDGEGVNLKRTSTINYRVNNYQVAWDTFVKNPVFGVGFNLYKYKNVNTEKINPISHSAAGSDSSLLFILATTGVVGLIAYLTLILKILSHSYSNRSTPSGMILLMSCVAIFAHSTFNNTLFYPWTLSWLSILIAIQTKPTGDN